MKFNLLHFLNAQQDNSWGYGKISAFKLMASDSNTDTQIAKTLFKCEKFQPDLYSKVKQFNESVDEVTSDICISEQHVRDQLMPIFRKFSVVADEFRIYHEKNRLSYKRDQLDVQAEALNSRKELRNRIQDLVANLEKHCEGVKGPAHSALVRDLAQLAACTEEI